jgi:antitoxin ParD1/3/4
MSNIAKRTVSLTDEQSAYIDDLVASGSFAWVSEVVRAGLRALEERDVIIDRWLRQEVAATNDAMKNAPERALSAGNVFDSLRQRYADRANRDA